MSQLRRDALSARGLPIEPPATQAPGGYRCVAEFEAERSGWYEVAGLVRTLTSASPVNAAPSARSPCFVLLARWSEQGMEGASEQAHQGLLLGPSRGAHEPVEASDDIGFR
jgi:hypothetical protein